MARNRVLTELSSDLAQKAQGAQVLDPDKPFLILVAGDFSGGSGRNRRPVQIDRDNFDQVMALFAPEIRVGVGGSASAIAFREMEDFHPDRLFERVASVRDFPEPQPRTAAPPANVSGADVLRMMMGEEPASPATPARSDWDQMLHEIVAPYAAPAPAPAPVEQEATYETRMRELLHAAVFQDLEAAWRGLYFLTRRLETGENLKVYVLDLPQEELTRGTGLADLARALEAQPFAVTAGLYYFAQSEEEPLMRIAAMSQEANAPFLTGLAPEIAGLQEVFPHLRPSLGARWVGLALPRFLLRVPYGKETSEIDSFPFEEMTSPPPHQWYLWGNPAIACAYLLGEAFVRHGWEFRPGMVQEIDSLPAHSYRADGEAHLKPCAEVLLTEDAAMLLLERGIMPLASIKDTDRIRLVRFQSAASPQAPLAGQWE